MKSSPFIFLLVLLLSLNVASAQTALAITDPDTLVRQLAQQYFKHPEPVGLSIGLYVNGKEYFYNFGTTEKGKLQQPDAKTIYEIGSITKTFTSTLLAYAVKEKKINLDDDIRNYLNGSYPNLAYKGHAVKIIHLANLTSALPNWLPDNSSVLKNAPPDSIAFILSKLHKNYTKQQFMTDLKHIKLDTIPGSQPRHSNVAAQLLGYILERVYNTPYNDLVKKYIRGPLGMGSTGLEVSAAQMPLLAKGYNDKGILMPYILKDAQAAGGIYSSTSDMLKYIKLQLDEKNEIIKLTHQPTWGNMNDLAIGLNWQMNIEDGVRDLWHTGGTFGFSSYIAIQPESNIGIVLLSNESDGLAQPRLSQIATSVLNGLSHK